jgi:hypothetical protein
VVRGQFNKALNGAGWSSGVQTVTLTEYGTPAAGLLAMVRQPVNSDVRQLREFPGMMTRDEFRIRFKEFLGADVYLRFIRALHRTQSDSRLRFWQQDAWDSFLSANPDCELTLAGLIDALRLCELHEAEMHQIDVPVCRHHVDHVREYERDRVARFPHARLDMIMVPEKHTESTCQMWVCPACDAVLDASRWRDG